MTVRHQCDLILSILCDVLEKDDAIHLGKWFDHVGFDPTALRHNSDLMQAWLGHYRSGRRYDVDRALNDLISWPPIADRIATLSKEKTNQTGRTSKKQRHEKSAI
ncbi:hypothetical protein MCELHM10_04116 [Paracoccaceae bacterium]